MGLVLEAYVTKHPGRQQIFTRMCTVNRILQFCPQQILFDTFMNNLSTEVQNSTYKEEKKKRQAENCVSN